jgi:hypothetical protein
MVKVQWSDAFRSKVTDAIESISKYTHCMYTYEEPCGFVKYKIFLAREHGRSRKKLRAEHCVLLRTLERADDKSGGGKADHLLLLGQLIPTNPP